MKSFWNASSPDELALVNAAKYFGLEFIGRDNDNMIVIKEGEKSHKFELLNVIEFTSARKRMTVIIREESTKKIKVLSKGADSILIARLVKDPKHEEFTSEFLEEQAKVGLRTLLLCEKEISE